MTTDIPYIVITVISFSLDIEGRQSTGHPQCLLYMSTCKLGSGSARDGSSLSLVGSSTRSVETIISVAR